MSKVIKNITKLISIIHKKRADFSYLREKAMIVPLLDTHRKEMSLKYL